MGPVTGQVLRAYLARRGGAPEDLVFAYRDGPP